MLVPLVALTLFGAPSPQDAPVDDIRELPSVAAGEAKEAFDGEIEAILERYGATYDPLQQRRRTIDEQHDAALREARAKLVEGLREANELAGRRGDVDEALRLESALQVLESGARVPVAREPGRPPRGALKHDGRRYQLFETARDWHAARRACEELGGQLACAETVAEYAFLVELAAGHAVWIGGTDAHAEGTWLWLSGSPVSIPWGPGQPDDYMRFEHSATIRPDGTLDDRLGTDPLYFLGEWGTSQAAAWSFESHQARKAKESYDRVAGAALTKRDAGRAKLDRSLAKPLAAAQADLERAQGELAEALEREVEAEVRAGRSSIALELREAAAAVRGGAYRPELPQLETPGSAPRDAIAWRAGHVKIFDERLPFRAAMERAEELGGRLVVLADDELRERLQETIVDEWHWVGAWDLQRDREFRWIDGRKLTEGWLDGEPNNWRDNEFAVVLTPGGLVDALSEERQRWICEWPN